MNEIARRPLPHMTADDFLAWPGDGTGRTFQLVDGEVRLVSPGSVVHGIIQSNLIALLHVARRATARRFAIVSEGAVIPRLNAATNVRVPDIVVFEGVGQRGEQTTPDPILLIEVLSPGNQDDTPDNVRAYATLPSVLEIVVVHSTRVLAEVHRRGTHGTWPADAALIEAGQSVVLDSAGLACPIEAAYEGTWLAQ